MADQPDVVASGFVIDRSCASDSTKEELVERARSHKVAHAIEETEAGLLPGRCGRDHPRARER